MEIKEIRKRVDALVEAMLSKALVRPSAEYSIRANCEGQAYLRWDTKNSLDGFKFFHGAPDAALVEAAEYVAALPTLEQRRMEEFMLSLGETIELGKKVDTEVDFINPLVVLMEKLSKNALTGPVA